MWETNIGCKQPSKVSEGFGPALTHPTQASYPLLRHAFGGDCVLSRRNPCKAVPMKIVLVVGPLFIALGLFWFGQGVGLLSGSHNAVLVDVGAGVTALGIGLVWFALR